MKTKSLPQLDFYGYNTNGVDMIVIIGRASFVGTRLARV